MKRHTDDKYKEYISRLTDIEHKHAPAQLYYEGDWSLITSRTKVSVVGSRDASPEGLRRSSIISKALVDHNIIVVSGLAKGIDTVAHRTAIDHGGKTIAVLGMPLDVVFPPENEQLLNEIKSNHLAISQFPSGHQYHKSDFPARNRTMALISDATIIVEAKENSGTRHQGWEALRLGRSVFIMENVMNDASLTWPKQMLDYGAQVLTKDLVFPKDGFSILEEIPNLTATVDCVF